MLQKIVATAITMSVVNVISAQDSTVSSQLSVTGSADVYYKYDFGKRKSNNLTSFTNSQNSFELGMASIKFDYKTGKTEMVADLGFGKRAQEFSYNDQGIFSIIKQAYISYSPAAWIKFTAGSWATHCSYEVPDAYLNRNYSTSYVFSNGPFFHTGIKVEFTKGKNVFMLGVANPTDYKYIPDGVINKKTFIAQYSYLPNENFKAFLNFVGGQGIDTTKSNIFNLVISAKLNQNFSLGFDGNITRKKIIENFKLAQAKSFWGSVVYVNYDFNKHFALTLREEYFSDNNRLKVYSMQANGGSVFASTLSANFKVDNLLFIPEFRMDYASQNIFLNKNSNPTKKAATILFAVIYQF